MSRRLSSNDSFQNAASDVRLQHAGESFDLEEVVMSRVLLLGVFLTLIIAGVVACFARGGANAPLPDPAVDDPISTTKTTQSAVVAGGCFWGIQAVFQHVKGVVSATSGYSGGADDTAEYGMVSTGSTGHAESVKVVYDPSKITYGGLLRVLFSVGHDPTQLNRQGPDIGSQYRSAIFYSNDEQRRIAEAYVAQLEAAKIFAHPIVTQVVPLKGFYPAESYHQNYAERHPNDPYIVYNDAPKLTRLRQQFPDLYTGK